MKSSTHTVINAQCWKRQLFFLLRLWGVKVSEAMPVASSCHRGQLVCERHWAETNPNEKQVGLEGEGEQIRESGGIRVEEAGGSEQAKRTKKWWENYQHKDKRPSSARTYLKLHWPFGDCFSNTTYRLRNYMFINSTFNQCQTLLDALSLKMYVSVDSGKLVKFFFFK